jgi:hypothetical protein
MAEAIVSVECGMAQAIVDVVRLTRCLGMSDAIVGVDFGMAQANVGVDFGLTRCFWNG